MQVIADLRALWPLRDFRKLFAVRLVSQAADGMFQVGLAALFFFSPEKASTASGVAIAFAVLLLPFTIVGPWAGVLLDRWRRRQVLFVGNLVRVALTASIAIIMLTAGVTPVVYALALVNLSANRFLLSALSASLPRTVDGPLLLTANSLTPTLGAAAAGLGGAIGLVLGFVLPEGRGRDATALIVAAFVMAAAALLSTRMGKDRLGPDERANAAQLREQLGLIFRGFVVGARYLIARRTPARALGIMAVHRFFYGVTFIASILIARNLLSDPLDTDDGLKTFASILGASALGFFLSVVVTPVVARRTGPQAWIVACLLLAAASQVLLATTPSRTVLLTAALLLGLAAQGAKIAVDTIVQRDTVDTFRGRAFALYDVLYNAAFVGAAALGALTLPDTGYSQTLFVVLAAGYLAGAVVFGLLSRGVGSTAVSQEPLTA